MSILLAIMAGGYALYNTIITKLFGWLPSVSASFYELVKKKKGGLFRAFIIFLALCCFIISYLTNSWAFAVAGAGAVFVYVCAEYNKDKVTELVHIIGAATLVVGSLLGIGLFNPSNWLNWIPAGIMALLFLIGTITEKVTGKELFKNSGLWYEHIATVVILVGAWIFQP